jgi:hypothetical protein
VARGSVRTGRLPIKGEKMRGDRAEKPSKATGFIGVVTLPTLPRSGPQGVDNGARLDMVDIAGTCR